MKKIILQDEYKLLKEGKIQNDVFIKKSRELYPSLIHNSANINEVKQILKRKNLISENYIDLQPVNNWESKPEEPYEIAYKKYVASLTENIKEEEYTIKETPEGYFRIWKDGEIVDEYVTKERATAEAKRLNALNVGKQIDALRENETPVWGDDNYKKLKGTFKNYGVNINIDDYQNDGGFITTYDNLSQGELQHISDKAGNDLNFTFKVGEKIKSQGSGYYFIIDFKTNNSLKESKDPKVDKEIDELNDKGSINKDPKSFDNLNNEEILRGLRAEKDDPKNKKKDHDQLIDLVLKNLSNDSLYYVKNAAFGIKGIGYELSSPQSEAGKNDQMTKVKMANSTASEKANTTDTKQGPAKSKVDSTMTMSPKSHKGIKKMATPGKETKVKLKESELLSFNSLMEDDDELQAAKKTLKSAEDYIEGLSLNDEEPTAGDIQKIKDAEDEIKRLQGSEINEYDDYEEILRKRSNIPDMTDRQAKQEYDREMRGEVEETDEEIFRSVDPEISRLLREIYMDSNFENDEHFLNYVISNDYGDEFRDVEDYTIKGWFRAQDKAYKEIEQEQKNIETMNESQDPYKKFKSFLATEKRVLKRKPLKEAKKVPVSKRLGEIEKMGVSAALEAKMTALDEEIDRCNMKLKMVDENSDLSDLVDKKQVKELQKDIKMLEKQKVKYEKLYEKATGNKKTEIIDEDAEMDIDTEIEEASSEDVKNQKELTTAINDTTKAAQELSKATMEESDSQPSEELLTTMKDELEGYVAMVDNAGEAVEMYISLHPEDKAHKITLEKLAEPLF